MQGKSERLITTVSMLFVGGVGFTLFILTALSMEGILPESWIRLRTVTPQALLFLSGALTLIFLFLAALYWRGHDWSVKAFTLLLVPIVISNIDRDLISGSMPQIIWIPVVAAFALTDLRWMLGIAAIEAATILWYFGQYGAFSHPGIVAGSLVILGTLVAARLLADTALQAQRHLRDEAERNAESLRQSEAKFSAAFLSSPDYMAISRLADGKYLEVNDAFETVTGYSRAEAVGKTVHELGIWAFPEEREVMVRGLRESGIVRDLGIRVRRRNGEIRDALVSAKRVAVNREDCVIVTLRDVTEQKRSAIELSNSEAMFAELFRSSPLALALMRHGTPGYMDVNDAWLRMLGQERRMLFERPLPDLGIWADHDARTRLFRQADAQEGPIGPFDMSLRRADGVLLECQLTASGVLEFAGERFRVWAYADLTQVRHAQRHAEELNASLEHRVRERTQELAGALASLRRTKDELVRTEKLSALGSLVAGVSHELNTPLGNALITASALQDKTNDFRREVAGGALRRSMLDSFTRMSGEASQLIVRNIEQAATLVSSFKQVAVDQTSMRRRPYDLGRTIEEVLATLHHRVRNGRVKVETALPPGVQMEGYPGPLGQVVTNLFTNSLMHGFDGKETGRIRIEAAPDGADKVVIRFSDDGNGIAPSDLPRIFDPFFTTRMGRGGTGLGLNIVHNIVANVLGGRIEVKSRPGEGATFELTLPTVAPASPAGMQEAPLQI